jgi:hypothetical protein
MFKIYFLCLISIYLLINGFIFLHTYVSVPAHFKSKFSAQTIKKGQQVLIVCDAFGEIPISIIVSKDRMQFDPSLEPRYEIIKNERNDGFSLTLKIVDCDRRDSALFTCISANSYGKDEYNVQVIVQGIHFKILSSVID